MAYLSTGEVARRLGVKPETVYAYVSRGLLTSVPRRDGRRGSLFAEDEVAAVAERGPHRRRSGGDIHTELTRLGDDGLFYRGRDVAGLAATMTPEAVAHLLWTGEEGERSPFPAPAERVALARAVTSALPDSARLTDRVRVAVVAMGAADPLRFDLSTGAVVRTAEQLMGVLVDALAPPSALSALSNAAGGGLGRRLWPALSPYPEPPGLLDAALVLLADHGLAVSTVAARVAASARAHPYAVVSAALGALDGHYHGAASGLAYRFLADARRDPVGAMSERMRAGEGLPGFGHRIYRRRDPRASVLLALLRERPEAAPIMATVDAVLDNLDPDRGQFPNADLALAALMHAYGMPADAGETIFAVARTVGWVAHAIEEYAEPPLRLRPLAD
ncbi:citrate synthase [Pseudonocardia acaciae]|uniref:citrate synthase n=1 Tax=Pseudonocardia acaciae TaxID=551276 RepID=UPI00049140D0|nr:citrate synthase [Pseudonocardia acaciae]